MQTSKIGRIVIIGHTDSAVGAVDPVSLRPLVSDTTEPSSVIEIARNRRAVRCIVSDLVRGAAQHRTAAAAGRAGPARTKFPEASSETQ